MSPEQIAAMAGTNSFKGGHVGGSYVDTITLGKDGKFYKAFYSQPKDEREDPKPLGESVDVTILKIRGKLTRWENNQQTLESVEYDAGNELVATSKGEMSEATAKSIGAKKALVVYALHDGNIVKLTVSGGSLYNPDDEKNLRLYSYLQSFEGDEHSFMVETTIKSILNEYEYEGEKKTSYHMCFKAGKTSDLEAVGEALKALIPELIENDARDAKFIVKPKSTGGSEGAEAVEGEEDPEDEPF